jgi:hypothetical protein
VGFSTTTNRGKGLELAVTIPVRTCSEANSHEHWRYRQRRAQIQRGLARQYVFGRLPRLPATVTLTRLAPRKLDSDNLASAMKHVRDGVADAYGVDDRSALYRWDYAQEKAKEYGVRIEVKSTKNTGNYEGL